MAVKYYVLWFAPPICLRLDFLPKRVAWLYIPSEGRNNARAVATALIGGGGEDIHIFVLCPTNFF